jgi:hypothetical protein
MNERQWELYRLSVVEKWAESPYKKAVSAAIEHKLMVLGQHTAAREANPSSSRARRFEVFWLPNESKCRAGNSRL